MSSSALTPHGPGFRFIDSQIVVEAGKKVIAQKWLDPNMAFFADHFPGEPLMPAVLLIEAAAQASGCVWGSEIKTNGEQTPERFILARVLQFSVKQPVYPDQTLEIESTLDRNFGTLGQFNTQISVQGEIVAQGVIVLSRGLVPQS